MESEELKSSELCLQELAYWRAFTWRLFLYTVVLLIAIIFSSVAFKLSPGNVLNMFQHSSQVDLPDLSVVATVVLITIASNVLLRNADEPMAQASRKLGHSIKETTTAYRFTILALALVTVLSLLGVQERIERANSDQFGVSGFSSVFEEMQNEVTRQLNNRHAPPLAP